MVITPLLVRCRIILGRAWVNSKLHLEWPYRHATICPAGLLWLHGHGYWLNFTVKPWARRGKSLLCMSGHARHVEVTLVHVGLAQACPNNFGWRIEYLIGGRLPFGWLASKIYLPYPSIHHKHHLFANSFPSLIPKPREEHTHWSMKDTSILSRRRVPGPKIGG